MIINGENQRINFLRNITTRSASVSYKWTSDNNASDSAEALHHRPSSKMSKKSKKNEYSAAVIESKPERKPSRSLNATDSKLSAVIGASNLVRWTQVRNVCNYQSNEEFVKVLLDLAAVHLVKNNTKCANKQSNHDNHKNEDNDNETKQKLQSLPEDHDNETHHTKKEKEHKHKKRKSDEQDKKISKPKLIQSVNNIAKDKKSENKNDAKIDSNAKLKPSIMVNISNDLLTPSQARQPKTSTNIHEASKVLLIENIVKPVVTGTTTIETNKAEDNDRQKIFKREVEYDIKRTELQLDQISPLPQQIPPLSQKQMTPQSLNKSSDKILENLCGMCDNEHLSTESCLWSHPQFCINDSITLEMWKTKCASEVDTEEDVKSFAVTSLPIGLKLDDVNQSGWENQLGVFATQLLEGFTQFGPLVAPLIKEVDVAEDCTMRYMFEIIKGETDRVFFNAENEEESNWLRYLRPAPTREMRNVLVVNKKDCLYFVTSRCIAKGEELVYWQDDLSGNKKKMEKTNCGGCNMTFQHPLFYRIHCSVFHDVRYSLTIRKYHCKVCGAAVLGKENIMKHASELHNGQGAYQCQFCKKFFLRLNYLEMHRTYGCSANPHRSRPLCDFCGRKFCQPQKLKVHIKRMHSDMSEVLKEFQCKNCMKILGSRAALQRHFKEVHQKQMDGACACNKCGKTFQNRSNLKIHMLTHSGIKPFRCNQNNCAAAFTTKQCLQFHYKKVHGYTEDMMPKIERSVDYTFEAYSGNGDEDMTPDAILSITEAKTEDNNHAIANTETILSSSNSNSSGNIQSSQERLIVNEMDTPAEDDDALSDKQDAIQADLPTISHSPTPPTNLDMYPPNIKILSKGSKKWIGEPDMYVDQRKVDFTPQTVGLNGMQHTQQEQSQPDEQESQTLSYEKSYEENTGKILGYNRHESNASLLVEAALDSVCSEPNIDIDVANTPCTESLVNNLYTLSNVHVHDNDSLADVPYPQSVDATDSRDINLISPSVNEQISVTDDIDELRHNQPIGIDYSSFHQEDFSPPNSPRNFRDYMPSPQGVQIQTSQHTHAHSQHHQHNHSQHNQHPQHSYEKQISPGGVASPPRYDFGAAAVNQESDDSNNGIGVQNLSLHAEKFPDVSSTRDGIQLDLSIYKSHYSFDSSFLRKDSKRFEIIDVTDHTEHDNEHTSHNHKNYLIDNEDTNKFSLNGNVDNENLDSELKDFEGMEDADVDADVDGKSDKDLDLSVRSAVPDLRSKFDLDLDLRKTYEIDGDLRRTYDTLDDFRIKNYDLDNLDALRSNLERKTYESIIEDFRTDRNFEPLVLNPSELQGLDMSARGYHNYPNLNRYHPLYAEVDRPTVDLRLNYSPPPPPPAYTHPDILRVSLDLAQPTRHSVDLSLRSQIANSRLLTEHSLQTSRLSLDQGRLLPGDLTVSAPRHIPPDRLISDMSNRILSDHTTNRLLGNDQLGAQRLMGTEQRMLPDDRLIEQPRLLDQNRLLGNGSLSPVSYSGYSVSPSPYHPTALPPRPHVTSPTPTPYHHYSAYY